MLGNVLLGLDVRGLPRDAAIATARDHIARFGLTGFENAYPATPSDGMRQRVALIRTLIQDPNILLLDEPFPALDDQTRRFLEGVLLDAVATCNKTVILITHDGDEALALSNRVIVLSGRPTRVKAEHSIAIDRRTPIDARSDPRLSGAPPRRHRSAQSVARACSQSRGGARSFPYRSHLSITAEGNPS